MSSGHLKQVQVIRLPHESTKMWITRNKGRLSPYLVWLNEPTLINKRYWVFGRCPVMMLEMIDWPKDWPNLKRGEKMRVNLKEVKK